MDAFGLNAAFFETNPSLDQVATALVGRRANVELGVRVWQGTARPQFENLRPVDGQMPVVGIPNFGPSIASPGGASASNVPPMPSIPATAPVTAAPPATAPPALPF